MIGEWMREILEILWGNLIDVTPIAVILIGFQVFVLRKKPPRPARLAVGFLYVVFGLAFFLFGLEKALFPLGETMARQLTDPGFLEIGAAASGAPADGASQGPALGPDWRFYLWVYIFAAAIGFSTTAAEPALIAVAVKAEEISGGGLSALGLRLAVAVGVAIGVALGAFRIITGLPLYAFITIGYIIVIIQTVKATRGESKWIIPLAYDSGGVTTSTVTVPVVAALGLGLAEAIPGRSPLLDGFGLIAFASLFPMMTVMAYAELTDFIRRRMQARQARLAAATEREEEA